MAMFRCLSSLIHCKRKKNKTQRGSLASSAAMESGQVSSYGGGGVAQVKPEDMFAFDQVKVVAKPGAAATETEDAAAVAAAAYEGGDELDGAASMKRDYSDFDLQALGCQKDRSFTDHGGSPEKKEIDGNRTPELGTTMQSGHVSDPGIGRRTTTAAAMWGSPRRLVRSCSNIETKRAVRLPDSSPAARYSSYGELRDLSGDVGAGELLDGMMPRSPMSGATNCSADKVMLKKRSSSHLLPSRSRKLWWRLFLWSHRNVSNPPRGGGETNQRSGYFSDKDVNHATETERRMKEEELQWVAFPVEYSSRMDRVGAWVNSLDEPVPFSFSGDDGKAPEFGDEDAQFRALEIGESSSVAGGHSHAAAEEVVQANRIIQSLSTASTVAHIAGVGLKVLPSISAFSSLRAVNLSGNLIAHISPASLPKGLHTLDLSRNRIAAIEGLRVLTRLRVLNLSYNRISRIDHGLSRCTLIKELYLAGNKIGDVEGLHRLLKLTVLDLSFNKIATTKALGQLVANYNSLLALNLLGNPIQANIGDDHLRKAVSGLLPRLAYLNKQPIKPQRGRDAATDTVAKAALGNGAAKPRRKMVSRVSHASSGSSSNKVAAGGSRAGDGPRGSKEKHRRRRGH